MGTGLQQGEEVPMVRRVDRERQAMSLLSELVCLLYSFAAKGAREENPR